MEGRLIGSGTTAADGVPPPLHTVKAMRRTIFNRVFATTYALAVLALLYHHAKTLFYPETLLSFSITLALLISDLALTFMWVSSQAYRMFPVCRKEFPQNLEMFIKRRDFPALDVFICTADPYKEPPIGVVNTALSVLAYEYPTEKITVYVSDDGGSAMALFALMEAAKFAAHWLPFCKKNNILERSPEDYFVSNHDLNPEVEKMKVIYERMKVKVEHVLVRGKVDDQFINGDEERQAFNKWTENFTKQDHPSVIQVLLDATKDKDIDGHSMPNLIYVSREKSKASSHHFKAGALNALLRVSASITNAPVILFLDCDFRSNDPRTVLRVMCYLCDPTIKSNFAFVQFPQMYSGINKKDIYCGEFKYVFQINPKGMDGIKGPCFAGTGCFFRRKVFFRGPSSFVSPEIPELISDYTADKLGFKSNLALAQHVSNCDYENQTKWGSEIGFRYGSLVEDYYTSFRLHCEGWESVFCTPDRPAFLGEVPNNLLDVLNQQKRWTIGHLEVVFSKYCPAILGVKEHGLWFGLGYTQLAFWAIWSIPITTYAFLPQLTLLNKVYIFPKVSEPWFLLYVFLFLGDYGQNFLEFILTEGSAQRWWSDQRFWLIRGLTSYMFGSIEFFLKCLGFSAFGFNVTSKVPDGEQIKRYEQGIFEFKVHSPMFVTIVLAAIINLISLVQGLVDVIFNGNDWERVFMQMFLSGFGVANSWPIYEAIVLRNDKGKMNTITTIMAIGLAGALYIVAFLIFS